MTTSGLKKLHLLFTILVFIGLAGCVKLPPPTPYSATAIPVSVGPEDLVLEGNRVLIACRGVDNETANGEVYALPVDAEKARILPRVGEPDSLFFQPHGIYLSRQQNIPYLYVITHNDLRKTHPVVKYQVFQDRLEFREIFNSPLLNSPNALVVAEDGSFFLCNDAHKRGNTFELMLGLKKCTVVHFDGKDNWKVVAKKLGMATGINRIGDTLYLSATREHKIYQWRIENDELKEKKVFAKVRGSDNLRVEGDLLLTGNHYKSFAFIKHMKDTLQPAPSVITQLDTKTGAQKILFSDPGDRISTASGAVRSGRYLFLPQVFRSTILKVELPEN